MAKMEIIRPATVNERRFITSDSLGFSHCIVLTARYTGALSLKDKQATLVKKAVQYCVDEHPILRVMVRNPHGKQPQLALIDDLDINQHLVHVSSSDAWQIEGQNEEQQNEAFLRYLHQARLPRASERPQWCVYLTEIPSPDTTSFHLAFMHSHVFWDGLGTIVLHETFLKGLNSPKPANFENLTSRKGPEDLLPPVEAAGKLKITWGFFLTILIQTFCPVWFASLFGIKQEDVSDVWTGPKTRGPLVINQNDPPTEFGVALIPKRDLSRAIQVCRLRRTRLTGLLTHLVARALLKRLWARGQQYHKINAANAIDLRRALGKGQGALANYVSFVCEIIEIKEDDLNQGEFSEENWEAIRETTRRLAETSSTLANHPVALLKYISDIKQWLQNQATQPATVSFGLSNLGVLDGVSSLEAGAQDWIAESAVVSQSGNKTGSPLNFQLLSTKNGCMGVTASWWPGMLGVEDENDFVQEVLDDLKEHMMKIK